MEARTVLYLPFLVLQVSAHISSGQDGFLLDETNSNNIGLATIASSSTNGFKNNYTSLHDHPSISVTVKKSGRYPSNKNAKIPEEINKRNQTWLDIDMAALPIFSNDNETVEWNDDDENDQQDDDDDENETEDIRTFPQGSPVYQLEGSFINTNQGKNTDFWHELGCPQLFSNAAQNTPARPIHDQSTWMYLRRTYYSIAGSQDSTIDEPTQFSDGFLVPIYIAYHPQMGRGVFADRFIPKGTKVWDDRNTACFDHGWQFRNFLLTIPGHLACDVLAWSYARDMAGQAKHDVAACCDLDGGSFVNGGDEDVNISVAHAAPNDYFYATTDIYSGEQILADYEEFAYKAGWADMGL